MRKMLRLLGLVVCLFFVLAPLAIAQVDYCEGNFDYDRDQDGTDAFTFKADFGRSTLLDPCPADGPASIPMTGQRLCYDSTGTLRNCVGTGEDGEYQSGIVWPNPRFTDNGDGTVLDTLTGLIWLKNADCFSTRTWDQALSDCNGLASGSCGLTDGSGAGDWRLPNYRELFSLVDPENGSPSLPSGHPFSNVRLNYYWSSTTYILDTPFAWIVNMNVGSASSSLKTNYGFVWPVRGGRVLTPF